MKLRGCGIGTVNRPARRSQFEAEFLCSAYAVVRAGDSSLQTALNGPDTSTELPWHQTWMSSQVRRTGSSFLFPLIWGTCVTALLFALVIFLKLIVILSSLALTFGIFHRNLENEKQNDEEDWNSSRLLVFRFCQADRVAGNDLELLTLPASISKVQALQACSTMPAKNLDFDLKSKIHLYILWTIKSSCIWWFFFWWLWKKHII